MALALASSGVASAQTLIRDTYSVASQWNFSNRATPNQFEPSADGSIIVGFPVLGNGEQLRKVGGLFVFENGETGHAPINNPPDRLFHLRFMFWSGLSDFQSDPRRITPPQSAWLAEFSKPSFQPGWQVPVFSYLDSQQRERMAFWIEVDVSSLGIQTVAGATHFLGLANDGDEIIPGVVGRLKMALPNSNSIVAGADWQFRGISLETKSFPQWNLTDPNVAVRVTTIATGTRTISGNLVFGDTQATFAANRTMTYQLTQGTSTVQTGTVVSGTSTAPFSFTVPQTATGAAVLTFDGSSFLKRSVNINLTGTTVAVGNILIQNGDVDASGEVDAADIDLVIAEFGSLSMGTTDVDVSGEVDAADIDIVIANFGGVDD